MGSVDKLGENFKDPPEYLLNINLQSDRLDVTSKRPHQE